MIRSFADGETELIWSGRRSRRLPPDIQPGALRKLRLLNQARLLDDLRVPPGNRLEALKGALCGRTFDQDQRPVAYLFRLERGRTVSCRDRRLPLNFFRTPLPAKSSRRNSSSRWGKPDRARARLRRSAASHQRDRARQARHHRRYRSTTRALFRYLGGVFPRLADRLRMMERRRRSGRARGDRAAGGVKANFSISMRLVPVARRARVDFQR